MFYQLRATLLDSKNRSRALAWTPVARTMVPLLQSPSVTVYSVHEAPTPDGPWDWVADFKRARHAQCFLINLPEGQTWI